MKQVFLLFLLLIAIMVAVYWMSNPGNSGKLIELTSFTFSKETPSQTDKDLKVGDSYFKIVLADTDEKRQVGLSNHTGLGKDEGMLFIFEEENQKPVFWMKGMDFSIDIIWINDNKVVQITSQVPVPKAETADSQLPKYLPNQEVDYVLEVAAGIAKEKNIKVGDEVQLPK